MHPTRRSVLITLAGATASIAQTEATGFAVTGTSGLKIQAYGDLQRPTVALFLPGGRHPAALIEMPEHAWRRDKPGAEPAWFYKMYSADPLLQGTVEWSGLGNALSYSMTTPSGFSLKATAALESDGVAITHEIASGSSLNPVEVQAPTCVKLYRPFTDVFLERTYVHHASGPELIAVESPHRLTNNAEEWLPCRYIVRCGNSPPPPKLIERVDGVTRYYKSKAADVAIIATESNPPGWVAATHGLECPSIFTNPARTCHHADPQALSITDGKARLRLKVYMLRGAVKDAFDLVSMRDRAGRV